MLSQVYFLISGIRLPDVSSLSLPFQRMVRAFRGFTLESAHHMTPEARGFHTESANAGLGHFELQGRGVRNRHGL